MVVLSSTVTWRFINLKESLDNLVGKTSHTDSMLVNSNLGHKRIVGNWTTDLWRVVAHLDKGDGMVYYEPSQEY